MSALYLDYRPIRFADLIGQEPIARTLRNQVVSGELAHAYLFAGIRGTGKTSSARILARAINCLDAKDGEPCGECTACKEIGSGAAVDVLEIDAASNRGIDEMRDLREKVKFMPASLHRKIYIIDEAHMLTTEAWNAFLKTLEEPPAHVLFVLCTTEPHKVPDTVRSRVHRFDFRRVGPEAIRKHLGVIAKTEKVEIEDEALDLCTRAAAGSVRDALSLLDQVIAAGEQPISAVIARIALGLADPDTVRELMTAVAAGDGGNALRLVNRAFDRGADPRQLLRDCSRLARAVQLRILGATELSDLAGADETMLPSLVRAGDDRFWLSALEIMASTELELRQPVDARLQVEICFLRVCQPQTNVALTSASPTPEPTREKDERDAPDGVPGAVPTTSNSSTPLLAPSPTPSEPSAQPRAVSAAIREEKPIASKGSWDSRESWTASWPTLVEAVKRKDVPLAGVLNGCKVLEVDTDTLTIGAPYKFHLDRLREPAKAGLLAAVVAELSGKPLAVKSEFTGDEAKGEVKSGSAGESLTNAVLASFAGSRVTSTRLKDNGNDVETQE